MHINGTCIKRPSYCNSWYITENDEIICTKCDENSYFSEKENKCLSCSKDNDEGMKGCNKCGYNEKTQNL